LWTRFLASWIHRLFRSRLRSRISADTPNLTITIIFFLTWHIFNQILNTCSREWSRLYFMILRISIMIKCNTIITTWLYSRFSSISTSTFFFCWKCSLLIYISLNSCLFNWCFYNLFFFYFFHLFFV